MDDAAEPAREAFARRAWGEAYALLASAEGLGAADLERLAIAAHLVGRDRESARAWETAHHEHVRAGDVPRAAACAFWLGLQLLLRGESAPGTGWLARAERLVAEAGSDCAARGLVLVPAFMEALARGDHAAAADLARETVALARRCGDADVLAFGLLCRGEAALAAGDIRDGMRLLDEAMVAVTTDGPSPMAAGIVYCAVVEACVHSGDLRRAAEWTAALDEWCSAQRGLVPYRGQCLVHRSQVLQAHGAWTRAMAEAQRACEHLADPAHPALGVALYQQGELHRLRGSLGDAERAYRAANEQGYEPVPGLALLRLAEGDEEAASASVRRMLEDSRQRPHLAILAAAVEVFLAVGDVQRARSAADELTGFAERAGVPHVRAMASYTHGATCLAEGDPSGASTSLRAACTAWRDLGLPYEIARARVLLGLACRALGDEDAAQLEFDGARGTFARLGAEPDVARVDRLATSGSRRRPEGRSGRSSPSAVLTERECEVLRLVALGKTNRSIAAALTISEHTVARHLQNVFSKLSIRSRAAATVYAYEHGLLS